MIQRKIYDVKTGEETFIDLTPAEVAEREKKESEIQAELLAMQQAEAERQARLESAKAKLAALGLDEAEINAVLGL